MRYDIVIVGSGPSGQKGAIAAAKMGRSVAIVERRSATLGGVCLHTGTIPSKTMREAILHLTGYRQRDVYAESFRKKRQITMSQLRKKLNRVTEHEVDVIQNQLERNRVDVVPGHASFASEHEIRVGHSCGQTVLEGENIMLAVGSKPARPANVPFDKQTIFDSDEILAIEQIPRSMIVVGGGVIGVEYAIMFGILGVTVTLVDGRERLLEFCDREIVETLLMTLRHGKLRPCFLENPLPARTFAGGP
jgi:NAD(P) transhydrogenase